MPRIHTSRVATGIGIALLFALLVRPPEPAQAAEKAPPLPAAQVRLAHEQVRMRDGVRLNTSVWLPGKAGRFPAILVRTPYRDEVSGRGSDRFNRFLEAGYAIVQQHERGRFLSEGEMTMLGHAGEDGWDTLDWIGAQPWSDGQVATYGCSSSAENQLKLSTLGHPAHKAVIAYSAGVGIAEAGPFREQGNFWRGGAWQMGWAEYFFSHMQVHQPQLPAGLSDVERKRILAEFSVNYRTALSQEDYLRARMHLPVVELGEALGAPRTELREYLERGPSHPAWVEGRITSGQLPKVPGLYAEALYDISARSATARFEETREAGEPGTQFLVLTNGLHCGFDRDSEDTVVGERPMGNMGRDYVALELAFLDRWLKGDTTAPLPESPVSAYLAGANRWHGFDTVPAAGDTRTLFLASGGKANTLDGDGVLLETVSGTAAADVFTYDPGDPVISHGGEIAGMGPDQADGAFDQRAIEARPDVLVYTSEPLAADLAVFGFIHAELFVSSDVPDTDFTVKLVDVAPDGTAWNIADTILRMRYREGIDRVVFMQPGQTYAITPPPMLAANVFLKGHRIRVEVSSSNFPSYARNLNTVEDPYTSTATAVAENRVRHGPGTPSRIELPVVTLPD